MYVFEPARTLLSRLGVDPGRCVRTIRLGRAQRSAAVLVAVEHDVAFVLDELALVVGLPQRRKGVSRGAVVVLADELLQVLGGLLAVICECARARKREIDA